ncbi:hypothetical protein C8C94_4866 [Acidovorax sp. 94]|uniref:hypothetical protein n=1 Tax=unclassified Acidovorax TaxID=2684926 RepID=UPI000EAED851|nr:MULTISPECIES: hypothetical protein [unclassified Acidovorax]MBV7458787.1 hypothetical protein [Acidovorax sp. sif0632]MBV7463391.1 hypothetical protein [Acidovorax sp. sif0613]RKR70319.1 hypothetical protein C8C94_4866 [Acidovorax sp. 94]
MEHENLFDILEHLEAHKRDGLLKVCREMRLSEAATAGVEQAARLLRHFETYQKPQIPTDKALRASLKKIEKKSRELRDAIDQAGRFDKLAMHQLMAEQQLGDFLAWPERVPLSGVVDYVGLVLSHMSSAAAAVQRQNPNDGRKGGRKRLLHRYYFYIDWVWESVGEEGLPIGRGGPFERLCDAVFVAAGVPATAEGAVRFFDENRAQFEEERASWRDSVRQSAESPEGMKRARLIDITGKNQDCTEVEKSTDQSAKVIPLRG